ncbi:hypothetical protein BDV38DRAFT_297153 [Aspergillus pseudotamarii]|uniref:Uncharacterized protein n=1 Tax=Aspergillus pseudotamarii TaxID=132259 RepID=A0A5N6SBT1_ASPPS|nr:uncharacterized protein BDV38DRAFT_297153 [Aspergillus pseudotamarii]KAE8132166.1 hypothetical protein BDV38DRAFT_297153 [Aspergillus pseudotamarii]
MGDVIPEIWRACILGQLIRYVLNEGHRACADCIKGELLRQGTTETARLTAVKYLTACRTTIRLALSIISGKVASCVDPESSNCTGYKNWSWSLGDGIWPLANVQSIVDSFLRPLWHQAYNQVDLIHIGELHGDVQLLRHILMGAYDVRFEDPNGDTALHRLYRDMRSAYEKSGRCLDLPSKYASEVKRRGFVHVAERAYVLPLTTRGNIDLLNNIIANWADGFEAYSLELLITELGKRYLEIFSGYASARQSLRKGVDGYLEIRMVAESLAS